MADPALPPGPLRVAAVQAASTPADLAGNALHAARLTAGAAARGAVLAVLPELFLPAYHPPTLAAEAGRCDLAVDAGGTVRDPRLDPLAAAAVAGGVVVLAGASLRHRDGRRTASVLVVDRSGTVRDAYDKQNLWPPAEPRLFDPGREGATVTVDGWRLGIGACYDGSFPEHARAAARAGAHAYLCPSAFLAGREHRRDLYFPTRALENTVFVVFSNVVGGTAPWRYGGGAAVYGPEGQVLARGPAEDEHLAVATLEPAELGRVREMLRMLTAVEAGTVAGPRRRRLVAA